MKQENLTKITMILALFFTMSLPACVVMSKKKYNHLAYITSPNITKKENYKKNVKLMSINSLINLHESKEDAILMKSLQQDYDIPKFHKSILEEEIEIIRRDQEYIMEEIRRRHLQEKR